MSEDLSEPSSECPDLSGVCGTISGPLVQQARDRIDNEIMLILRSLLPLRSRRNALAQACQLPAELLSMIFIHCAHDWYTDPDSEFKGQVAPWVVVSYVCRTWRDVALDCGVIRGYLFFVSLDWTLELLKRSRGAPLLVRVHLTDRTTVSLRPVLEHIERIEDMHVQNFRSDSAFKSLLNAEAPSLRSLQILSEGGSMDLFRGGTPALRKLDLHRCYTDWSSIFNELTHLSLSYQSYMTTVTFRDLLGVLRRSPCLQELYFEDELPKRVEISVGTTTDAVAKVTLLHLERITLIADISVVASLLARLEMPLFTAVRLTFFHNDLIQCTGTFRPSVSNRFHGGLTLTHSRKSSAPLLESLCTSCRDSKACGTSCTSSNFDINLPSSSRVEEQGSDIRTPLESRSSGWKAVIAVCRILPLIHFTKVFLRDDRIPRTEGSCWMELFSLAPRLCEIEVNNSCSGARSLISALRTDVLFAPALVNITIKQTFFLRGQHDPDLDPHPNTPCIWCLRDVLATRAKAGALLQIYLFMTMVVTSHRTMW
ncbi:hypothetical protein EDD16DRAFT_1083317 [Pisolithus croceorrhizus]|nr:hypothetical protein EDD16DRAFT_1083317 [Pisolithus croceorrhizus]KAI6135020.1 hypothetical protein EV401DRAFT_1902222 [Pisolithus croceorrhizus]KAI6163102.1 hypothetical protein EDD17DRAFT_512256 [Pisolithus thermaeus]